MILETEQLGVVSVAPFHSRVFVEWTGVPAKDIRVLDGIFRVIGEDRVIGAIAGGVHTRQLLVKHHFR